jgi:hypothetical protein
VNEQAGPDQPRQRIVRSRHGRRAQLTPAPGTTDEPLKSDLDAEDPDAAASGEASGPNDERMRRDVPPHY